MISNLEDQYCPTSVVDADGTDVDLHCEFEYSPFGKPIKEVGSNIDDLTFRFSTKYTDTKTDLVYYGYRCYNSELGRFMNRDPLGERGGLNLYAFVGNNPTNRWDFLGLEVREDGRYYDENGRAWRGHEGLKAIKDSLARLQKECECCVKASLVSTCKQQAKQYVDKIAAIWKRRWARGPLYDYPGAPKKSVSVGGWGCYHWARMFNNGMKQTQADINDSGGTNIWEFSVREFKVGDAGSGSNVHFVVRLKIKNPEPGAKCDGFNFDDGFADGDQDRFVGGTPCEDNKPPMDEDRWKESPGNPSVDHYKLPWIEGPEAFIDQMGPILGISNP